MKNRYTIVKTDVSADTHDKTDIDFDKLLCDGILLSLRDLGHLCEIEYRRARVIVIEKLGEQRK